MQKRPRIKGKGADIFLGGEEEVASKTGKQEDVKMAKQQLVEKATFYLPADLVDDLDEVKAQLRRRYRRAKKVSKSEIVRVALEGALEEWREKGEESFLANQVGQAG